MYGWLSTGGAFSNTDDRDIVLRTSHADNKVVIGNSNDTTAALYVSRNNVGVRCTPSDTNALEVEGDIEFITSKAVFSRERNPRNSISILEDRLSMQSSTSSNPDKETGFVDTTGLIKSSMLVADGIYLPQVVLEHVHVMDILPSRVLNGYNSIVDGFKIVISVRYRDDFTNMVKLIMINRKVLDLWRINDMDAAIQLEVSYHIPEQQDSALSFAPNDTIKMHLLYDVCGKTEQYAQLVNVVKPTTLVSHHFETTYTDTTDNVLVVHLRTRNAKDDYFQIGNCYVVRAASSDSITSSPNHLLRLRYKQVIIPSADVHEIDTDFDPVPKDIILRFEAPDRRAPLRELLMPLLENDTTVLSKGLLWFATDAYIPPPVTETNVGVGYYTNASDGMYYYLLNDTELVRNSSFASIGGEGRTIAPVSRALDYVIIGDLEPKIVHRHYQPALNGTVVVDTGNIGDANSFVIRRQTLSYEYMALPMIIEAAVQLERTTIRYTIDMTINGAFDLITRVYQGKYAYVMDAWSNHVWSIVSASTSSDGKKVVVMRCLNYYEDIGLLPYILTSRVINIVPFKFFMLTQLGTETTDAFIPTQLGIGTANVRETLTVAGSASFEKTIVIKDQHSSGPEFHIKYADNGLNLNGIVNVSPHISTFNNSVMCGGTLTAMDVYKASDGRIKQLIKPSCTSECLQILNDIKIHDYYLKGDVLNSQRKGVLAQELMMIVPDAVIQSAEEQVVECISCYVRVGRNGQLVTEQHSVLHNVIQGKQNDLAIIGHHTDARSQTKRARIVAIETGEHGDIVITLDPPIPSIPLMQNVYVVGIWDRRYAVNYEYLYMAGLCAMQKISAELEDLKKQMKHI